MPLSRAHNLRRERCGVGTDVGRKTGELVETVQIGFGAGFDDIGGGAAPSHRPVALLQLPSHLTHSFGAAGHRPNLVTGQPGRGPGYLGDGLADRVHGTIANGGAFAQLAVDAEPYGCRWDCRSAAINVQILELIDFRQRVDLVVE